MPSSPIPTIDSQRAGAAISRARESANGMRRVLILGGTTEARRLAERLAGRTDLSVTVSLAGRTTAPAAQAASVRIGGFGGAQGLTHYLPKERVDVLVHPPHPYPALISANSPPAPATPP